MYPEDLLRLELVNKTGDFGQIYTSWDDRRHWDPKVWEVLSYQISKFREKNEQAWASVIAFMENLLLAC